MSLADELRDLVERRYLAGSPYGRLLLALADLFDADRVSSPVVDERNSD